MCQYGQSYEGSLAVKYFISLLMDVSLVSIILHYVKKNLLKNETVLNYAKKRSISLFEGQIHKTNNNRIHVDNYYFITLVVYV